MNQSIVNLWATDLQESLSEALNPTPEGRARLAQRLAEDAVQSRDRWEEMEIELEDATGAEFEAFQQYVRDAALTWCKEHGKQGCVTR